MTVTGFYKDRTFFTPSFDIKLNGGETGAEVIADVLEVTFTDDLENVDSFEFNLNDWDQVARRPQYSSPWDDQGTPHSRTESGTSVPNFEPGAAVSLFLGYLDDGELPLIMDAEVVSLAPSFPAAGSPTCRVRALNALLRRLQKTHIEGNYSGTGKEIVEQLCRENKVSLRIDGIEDEGTSQERVEIDGPLYDEIASRAKEYDLTLTTQPSGPGGGEPTLYLIQPSEAGDAVVADLEWGRTLVSFTPVLSTAAQVSAVCARGADPEASGDEQQIAVTKTWADIGLSPTALGPGGSADLETATGGLIEIIKPDGLRTDEDAEKAATARLRELARTLITASGSAVGLPELRAGATVRMKGMGSRFDGIYRLTQSTHTIGASGYTTTFQARKEDLL